MAKKKQDETTVDFEQSVASIEALAERLESGELSLEESMKAFEEGIRLTRQAQKALADAEQKVQLLTAGDEGPEAGPMADGEDESAS